MLRVNIKTYEEPYETQQQKNYVISGHFYHFLLEGSDKLGCHAGVIKIAFTLTHKVVDWRILIFHIADGRTKLNL